MLSQFRSCLRCGLAYTAAEPGTGLCEQCISDLEALMNLAPVASDPCPACGGPVCADCGKALVTLLPFWAARPNGAEVNGHAR